MCKISIHKAIRGLHKVSTGIANVGVNITCVYGGKIGQNEDVYFSCRFLLSFFVKKKLMMFCAYL